MNKSYRSIWNPALGSWVAAPETARTGHSKGDARPLRGRLAAGVALALVTATVAWAGGDGGQGGWGWGSNTNNPGAGWSAGTLGGAGGRGGDGMFWEDSGGAGGALGGGAGSVSPNPSFGDDGDGGGGGGGTGQAAFGAPVTLNSAVTGGAGGAGATSTAIAGGGGGGGAGVVGDSNVTVAAGVTVTGGAGGDGNGQGGSGGGGGGGAGIVAISAGPAAGLTVEAGASVVGGRAGAQIAINVSGPGGNGEGGAAGATRSAGAQGGAGVVATHYAIDNYGSISGGLNADGTRAAAIRFAGGDNALTIRAGSSLTGALVVDSGATAVLTNATGSPTYTLGNAIYNNGAVRFASPITQGGVISGTGSVSSQASGGTVTFTADNTYTGTTTISAGTLQVGNGGTTGTLGTGAVVNNGTLAFARSDTLNVANAISGTGNLVHSGSGTLVLSGANSYSGDTTVNGGTLVLDHVTGSTIDAAGAGFYVSGNVTYYRSILIDSGATVRSTQTGTLPVAVVVDSGQSGTVAAATGTTLTLQSMVVAGDMIIGTTSDQGTVVLGQGGSQSASGDGTLRVGGGTLTQVDGSNALNFLAGFLRSTTVDAGATIDMNGSDVRIRYLDGAGTVTDSVGGRTLQVARGAFSGAIAGNTNSLRVASLGSAPDQTLVLTGTNTYGGSTTINAGSTLQLGAGGLTGSIDNTSAIVDNGSLVANRAGVLTLAAPISGAGTISQVGSGTTVLAGDNTYAGTTTISAGTLQIGDGGTSGTLGTGAVTNNAALVFNRSDSITVANAIGGTGTLTQAGTGTAVLTGTNTYTGGTSLKGGTLAVGNNSALGTGALAMDDGTTLAFAANDLTLANPITMTGTNDPTFDTGANTATLTGGISGAADLTKTGTGTLILGAANNTYTGSTTVAQGTLRAGVANAFAPTSATSVASGATLATGGFNQAVGSLTNAGTVSLLGATAGSTLTVNGNYVGNNGLLQVGTVLGDSSSATDKLVVTGTASGTTAVQVTNLNGLGGQTTGNGIQVVSAAGGIAGGAFNLATPVSAGAYDYQLNTAGGSAYLSSTTAPAPAPAPAPSPAPAPAAGVPTYRADVPLYAALPEQLRQSNLAMLGNLHQRTGDDGGTGSNTTSPDQGYRQAWGRVISIDRDISQSGTVSPTSSGRLTGFQAGTDLWANANWRTGVYVGQLEGDMSVSGFARGVVNYAAGSNDLRSQYLGAYATWKNDSGLYVDGVLQAGRHRYTASPTLAFSGSGKGDSLLASIEVGQAFAIAPNWTIEPQLQLVHQRLSLDDTSIVGAWVHQNTDGGWMARAGVRIKGEFQTGMGTLQPYARVNVYKRSSGTDTTSFIGPAASTPILTRTGGTSSEVALGATWQLSQSTSLYGELGKLWASGGDARTKSGVNGSLGVKVRW